MGDSEYISGLTGTGVTEKLYCGLQNLSYWMLFQEVTV
jgi:hypothetical protein